MSLTTREAVREGKQKIADQDREGLVSLKNCCGLSARLFKDAGAAWLAEAARYGHHELIDFLIQDVGVEPNTMPSTDASAAMVAVQNNDVATFERLVANGLIVDAHAGTDDKPYDVFVYLPKYAGAELAQAFCSRLNLAAERRSVVCTTLFRNMILHENHDVIPPIVRGVRNTAADAETALLRGFVAGIKEVSTVQKTFDPETIRLIDREIPDGAASRIDPINVLVEEYARASGPTSTAPDRGESLRSALIGLLKNRGQGSAPYVAHPLEDGDSFPPGSGLRAAVHHDTPALLDVFEEYGEPLDKDPQRVRDVMRWTLKQCRENWLDALMSRGISPYVAADNPLDLVDPHNVHAARFKEIVQRAIEVQPGPGRGYTSEDENAPSLAPGKF